MEILRWIKSKLFSLTYYASMTLGVIWILTDRVVQGLSTILLAIIASELIKLRRAAVGEDDPRWDRPSAVHREDDPRWDRPSAVHREDER